MVDPRVIKEGVCIYTSVIEQISGAIWGDVLNNYCNQEVLLDPPLPTFTVANITYTYLLSAAAALAAA